MTRVFPSDVFTHQNMGHFGSNLADDSVVGGVVAAPLQGEMWSSGSGSRVKGRLVDFLITSLYIGEVPRID